MRRKVYDSYDLSAKVADGRAQVTVDAIDTRRQVRQRARHRARGHRSRRPTRSPRPCRWRRPRPAATPPTSRSRSTAAICSRPCTSATARPSPSRSARSPCPTRSSTCARRPTSSRCKHAAQVSGGHDQAKPGADLGSRQREGQLHAGPVAVGAARRRRAVPARPVREARAAVRLSHDQVRVAREIPSVNTAGYGRFPAASPSRLLSGFGRLQLPVGAFPAPIEQ